MTDKSPRSARITPEEALAYHLEPRPGKFDIVASTPMATQRDLSLAYSPGVAVPVQAIADRPETAYDYTTKGNMVAVISNGERHRHRTGHRGRGRVHQRRQADGSDLWGHQPGRHQGARMLHHRAAPERDDGHPRLSRRPARHGGDLRGGPAERAGIVGQEDRGGEDRPQRRGCCRDRLPGTAEIHGRAA